MKLRTLVCILLLLSMLTSCSNNKNTSVTSPHSLSYYEYFDTVCTVSSYNGENKESFRTTANNIEEELKKYHRLFDIYNDYEGINNIKTINDNAGVSPIEVTNELLDFLVYAKSMHSLTDGKLNIALGSVLSIWHDHRTEAIKAPENASIPSNDKLQDAALHTDINNLVINQNAKTVYISDPDMSLNVGALGKGYATQKIAELLISRGISSYVLNMGGNIKVIGAKTDGNGWITGITNPDKSSAKQFIAKVVLKDISLVTSGNYERYYTVDGVNYHHIIDPDTLTPANYFSSVSVLTKDSALADALSTALFCMSYEDGLNLINKIGDVEVLWVKNDFTTLKTEGFELYSSNGK